ncbi:MAG: ABC transporter permease [Chitinophagales bacterium]|nr:ABC transporter permease [Chitinophagales bacterium]
MLNFILQRLLNGVLVLIGVIIIIFFLFNILPVNSARLTMGQRADAASVEVIEREFRLNEPGWKRFLLYVNDLSPLSFHNQVNENSLTFLDAEDYRFNKIFALGKYSLVLKNPYLGRSFQNRRKVSTILSEKIEPTIYLAVVAIVFASIFGIILGIIAALNQFTYIDNAAVVSSVIGISVPSYFSGFILSLIFGYTLHEYTGLNFVGSLFETNLMGEEIVVWKNIVLPAIALGIRPIAIITQLTRSSMLDVLNQDYIRTARSKGLGHYTVVFKHALRNALNPVVTSISGWFGALLAGAFFVEIVFDYKGLGYQTVTSLLNFDFPVVMGSVLFIASVFILVNIFVDILYAILDPRISIKTG